MRNRKAVESGLAEALTERNNLLDDLFTAEQVLVVNKDGENEEKTLIYCNNVSELVLRLLEDRGLEQTKTDAKFGLEKGRDSLKLTLSLMEKEERMKTCIGVPTIVIVIEVCMLELRRLVFSSAFSSFSKRRLSPKSATFA